MQSQSKLRKLSSLIKTKKSALFLALSLILILAPLHAEYLQANLDNIAQFHTYDNASMKYVKSGKFLNFSQGTWLLIEVVGGKTKYLEFHPDNSGTLIFSTLDNSKMLYLSSPERILRFHVDYEPRVMDSKLREFGGLEGIDAYLAMQKKEIVNGTFNGKPLNITIIYKTSMGVENFQKIMDTNKEKFLPKKDWTKVVNSWKKLPIYILQDGDENISKWPNNMGAFLDDGSNLKNWAISNKIVPASVRSYFDKRKFRTLRNRIVMLMTRPILFAKRDLYRYVEANYSDRMVTTVVHEFLDREAFVFIQAMRRDGDHSVVKSIENIAATLMNIAQKLIDAYFFSKGYPFFKDYFFNLPKSMGIDEWNEERIKTFKRFPQTDFSMDMAAQAVHLSDLTLRNRDYDGIFKDEVEIIKTEYLNIIENGFDKMVEKLQYVYLENRMDLLVEIIEGNWSYEETIAARKLYESDFKVYSQYDESKSEQIKENMRNMNFANVTFDLLVTEILPPLISQYETNIMNNLSEYPPVKKMKMNFKEDYYTFQVFRMGLLMEGMVDIMKDDLTKIKSVNEKAFGWKFGNMCLI